LVDEWIKGPPDKEYSALYCMIHSTKDTRVWLYTNGAGHLVGYGSVATTRYSSFSGWEYRGSIIEFPKIAVQSQFQGLPKVGPKYSDQIIDDLLSEACKRVRESNGAISPIALLWVDPLNIRAKRFYLRHHFTLTPQTFDEGGISYESMIRKLKV
jgi:hypothetical protein